MGKNLTNIILYKPDGSSVPLQNRHTTTGISSAKQTWALNADDVVDIVLVSTSPQSFDIGDRITIFGRDYKLNQLPTIKKNGQFGYEYNLRFEGVQYDLLRVTYDLTIDTTSNALQDISGDSLIGNLHRFMDVLIANANRVFPNKWSLGNCPETIEDKTLSFGESDNCLSVLQNLCSESNFNVEFDIVKDANTSVYIINLFNKVGQVLPYTFKYGKGNGLYELTRTNVSSSNIITRLKAYGSSQNITQKYRADRLCLPNKTKATSYIEKPEAVAKYGIFEGRKHFDDVKPTYTGTVTALGANIYSFVDSNFPFDLNEKEQDGITTKYLINGLEAKIHFNTGNLAGYDFTIKSYNHETRTFVINPFKDERGETFPSEKSLAFQFQATNTYKITDIAYPSAIEQAAELLLEEKANEYYDINCQPRVQYALKVTKEYLSRLIEESSGVVQNIFMPGDYMHIVDDDILVDKSIRVKSFVRDILEPMDYSLTIADTVSNTSIINRVVGEIGKIDKVVKINDLDNPTRARADWRSSREVMDMVFDPDGDYYSDKIKPNSIDTLALSVGAKSMQFGLQGMVFEPNYGGNKNVIKWNGGVLVHYTINETSAVAWNLANGQATLTSDSSSYYIYAKCNKSDNSGTIVLSTEQYKVDSGNYWYFWIGILNSVTPEMNARTLSLTYGFTMINGRFIKTGRIESSDGTTYFDLDNSEIGGRIVFIQAGQEKTLEELGSESLESKNYINNTLPDILEDIQAQIDGQIEQFFDTYNPTLNNAPANSWTTAALKESHLGDLFYNTDTGSVFRFIKNGSTYLWQELQDAEVAQALAIANDALALAKTKRRIFTTQPTPPYDIGDLWVKGSDGDILKCKTTRATGNFSSSDWELASKYTDDSSLNTFIDSTYSPQVNSFASQLDGKIETWFQSTDPATLWTTTTLKNQHIGDLWYNTTTNELKYYKNDYSWEVIEDATAIAAYEAASTAQDTADGKRRVFVTQPTPPYDIGDLWVDGTDLRRCATTRTSGIYVASDWVFCVGYDNTKTVIDGGLVTSGTIQVAGSTQAILAGMTGQGTSANSVRFWAGESFGNRANAPFRVLQDGSVDMEKAIVRGEMHATSGDFKNVDVYGSFRSPFVYIENSFQEQNSDNLVSRYISSHLTTTLPWSVASSGRRVTIVGSVEINAPSGKYFYENGKTHQQLRTSYEVVELLGLGGNNNFNGWIVMNRQMFQTNYAHGRRLDPVAFGRVRGSSSGATITSWTYDNSSLSVSRQGEGLYRINIPSNWFANNDVCFIQLTGYGTVVGSSTSPCKATIYQKSVTSSSAYFTVYVSDDATANDGSFEFFLYNAATWNDS